MHTPNDLPAPSHVWKPSSHEGASVPFAVNAPLQRRGAPGVQTTGSQEAGVVVEHDDEHDEHEVVLHEVSVVLLHVSLWHDVLDDVDEPHVRTVTPQQFWLTGTPQPMPHAGEGSVVGTHCVLF